MSNRSKTVFCLTATAAALLAVNARAAEFPGHELNVTTTVSYEGDASTDAVINKQNAETPNDNGGWDAINTAAGGKLTISGYRNFVISAVEGGDPWMYGVYAPYSGTIDIDVNNDINVATNDVSVHAMQDSTISLKAGNNVVLSTEDGQAVYAQQKTNISIEAGKDINLSGTGNVVGFLGADQEDPAEISLKAGNQIVITAQEGKNAIGSGTWDNIPHQSGVLKMSAPGGIHVAGNIDMGDEAGQGRVELEKTTDLYMHGNVFADMKTLAVDNGEGTLTVHYDTFYSEGKTQSVDNINGTLNVEVGHEGADQYSSSEAAQKLLESFDYNGTAAAYGTNYTTTVDSEGHVATTGSDITKMTNDLAAMSLVAWRNEVTTLNDRMSTLRSNPSSIGAWARYNGGEYQYDARSLKNQFNTIEVGADVQTSQNWIVGASLSYTKGDGDMDQGETDSDTYAGALYALWTHEKGSFVDMVMKVGRISNDFDFYNLQGGAFDHGTLDQTGFIVGIETGHRFALPMNTFIEPQLQLTYSRLSSVSETTAERRVELDAADSMIGRIGFMAGISCPNDRGSAYVKVSALRDFRGDIDGTYALRSGASAYSLSQELDDNWFEYAIGANFKLTDNAFLFADVAKSAGADIDLDWRANIGAKLFF